jgi:hypothetical protein
MTDHTSDFDDRRRGRTPPAEFMVYFAVIFAAALPFECIGWLFGAATGRARGGPGPVARALSTARIITPTIFSA